MKPLLVIAMLAIVSALRAGAQEQQGGGGFHKPAWLEWWFDKEDGYMDMSGFLELPYGFFPMVMPVTEPSIGYGAAFVPVFIKLPEDGKGHPTMGAAGVMETNNGSRAVLAGYSRYFDDDKWHVFGGGADASLNLDFYGLGGVKTPSGDPLEYNLDMAGGLIGADRKIGQTPWRAGLRYFYGEITPSVFGGSDRLEIRHPDFIRDFGKFDPSSTVSSIQMSVNMDTRDNTFTPTKGIFTEFDVTVNAEAIGGSTDYQLLDWTGLWYHPLVAGCLFLGLRGDVSQSFGDVPFYRRPYVKLRGAPAMAYQGAGLASTEAELRWQFLPRWSLVGFAGGGITWPGDHPFEETETTFTGGAGFRYLIARRHGLHAGVDIAYGEEGPAVYIQFGSGWFRP